MFTEGKALVFIRNLNSTFPIVTRLIAVIATDISFSPPLSIILRYNEYLKSDIHIIGCNEDLVLKEK